MRLAETVTFGGGSLDRATHLRNDASGIARLAGRSDAGAVALWQGKILLHGDDPISVARLPLDSAVFSHADAPPVFLGNADSEPVFALDMSGWKPDGQAEQDADGFDTSPVKFPGLAADYHFGDLREVMAQLTSLDAELATSAKAVLGWHSAHGFCAKCGQKTVMSMAGWQRQCPACGTNHFPRTDPVVIMLITRGNNVLLGRSPDWPKTMYSLLAGFVEPGETLENAVRREVHEEAGIRVGAVSYLASQPWPFPASLMVGCRGDALDDKISLDPVELEAAVWLSREDLMDVFAGLNPEIQAARRGSIAHFLLQNWLADRLD